MPQYIQSLFNVRENEKKSQGQKQTWFTCS